MLDLPLSILTDSYKASHFKLYPPGLQELMAYGEFRSSFEKDTKDERILFYGIRYIIENYIAKPWTIQDVERASDFFKCHNLGSEFPFPKDLFLKFILENGGAFPVKIDSLKEGSTVYPHVPVYQITASKEYAVSLFTLSVSRWLRTWKHF